jgi:hypothetical protein
MIVRRRRIVHIDDPVPDITIECKDGNLCHIQKCGLCKLDNKRFTMIPPLHWNKSLTWQYPSVVFHSLLTMLMLYKRQNCILSTVPKDLLIFLFKYIARGYTQDTKQLFRGQCDDCTYYYKEITRET